MNRNVMDNYDLIVPLSIQRMIKFAINDDDELLIDFFKFV